MLNYDLAKQSQAWQQRVLGDGFHLGVAPAWVLYVLSNVVRRELISDFTPRTISLVHEADPYDEGDDEFLYS